MTGGNNFWSSSYSPRTKLLYIPSRSNCDEVTLIPETGNNPNGFFTGGAAKYTTRNESDIIVADPFTGEIKNKLHAPYPNNSAALTTAGGLLITAFTDGTIAAYDDATLEELWKLNVGTGINAPPMTFEVGGKQYIAVLSGLSRNARNINSSTPELRELRNQTMLFVFTL